MSQWDDTSEAFVNPLDTGRAAPNVLCVGASEAAADHTAAEIERHGDGLDLDVAVGVSAALDGLGDVDCIVADHDLGEATGCDLLAAVRDEAETLPVVLLVEDGDEETAAAAVNAGADGYVRTGPDGDPSPYARVAECVGDVVDRDRSRAEHEEAARLLTQLTSYTVDALWMFSADWSELVFINSAYEDIFGEPMESIIGAPQSFVEAVHPEDRQRVMETMQAVSEGEARQLEFRVNPDEDYRRWVSVHAEPTRDEDGAIEHVAGFTRDVTRRKKRERALEEYKDELERSNQSLKEFAYIASHDLQEPLRMVSSYVDLLEQEYGDRLDDEAEEYMTYATEGAQRMKEMINSLLEYSRVHSEAGATEPVDAGAVFEDARQNLELLIEERDATVLAEDLPTVEADPDQLGQVFQNLVKNAIEHADEGDPPRVEVSATAGEDVHEFAVADDGPGIEAGQEENIFEIFSKGSRREDGEGTGIGLAITKRIVERHGGDIWVESTEGEGATFRFSLPSAVGTQETRT